MLMLSLSGSSPLIHSTQFVETNVVEQVKALISELDNSILDQLPSTFDTNDFQYQISHIQKILNIGSVNSSDLDDILPLLEKSIGLFRLFLGNNEEKDSVKLQIDAINKSLKEFLQDFSDLKPEKLVEVYDILNARIQRRCAEILVHGQFHLTVLDSTDLEPAYKHRTPGAPVFATDVENYENRIKKFQRPSSYLNASFISNLLNDPEVNQFNRSNHSPSLGKDIYLSNLQATDLNRVGYIKINGSFQFRLKEKIDETSEEVFKRCFLALSYEPNNNIKLNLLKLITQTIQTVQCVFLYRDTIERPDRTLHDYRLKCIEWGYECDDNPQKQWTVITTTSSNRIVSLEEDNVAFFKAQLAIYLYRKELETGEIIKSYAYVDYSPALPNETALKEHRIVPSKLSRTKAYLYGI